MKKRLILILILLSWVVTLLHRVWNDDVAMPVGFPFNDIQTDIQWYLCDTGIMLSILCILGAFLLYVNSTLYKDKDVKILIQTISIVWVLDIVHYVLWFKQNELVLLCESIIVIAGTVLMLYRNGKENKNY